VTSKRGRNDAQGGRKTHAGGRQNAARGSVQGDWLWGWHTVIAALENPRRDAPRTILATEERGRQIAARLPPLAARLTIGDPAGIARRLPSGAVHQGIAVDVAPLEPLDLDELAANPAGVILVLDQVTDPQNVGGLFRSAAAFGARGVVLQTRNAPAFTGALAKAAAGAVDLVPFAEAVNLSRALEQLSEAGWRTVGLAGEATTDLADALDGTPTALVLGSEGEGLRRLVAEHCDVLARIPMPGGFESLNVATAGAIALYEAARPR
jgi:23S rRNA (guanosine2251-2'-O)-methyltransferase